MSAGPSNLQTESEIRREQITSGFRRLTISSSQGRFTATKHLLESGSEGCSIPYPDCTRLLFGVPLPWPDSIDEFQLLGSRRMRILGGTALSCACGS